jgi:hypothetical protein
MKNEKNWLHFQGGIIITYNNVTLFCNVNYVILYFFNYKILNFKIPQVGPLARIPSIN